MRTQRGRKWEDGPMPCRSACRWGWGWPLPGGLPYPLWGRVDQGTVEARGLGIQGQHELFLLEQGFGVRLRVGLPLGQWDDTPPAQGVSPGGTLRSPTAGGGPSRHLTVPGPTPPWSAHLLFAFFINVVYLIPAGAGGERDAEGSRRKVGRGAAPGARPPGQGVTHLLVAWL